MATHSETVVSGAQAAGPADATGEAPHAALAGNVRVPPPVNDSNRAYLPGSPERASLKSRLSQMASERIEIPVVVAGREIRTGRVEQTVMPHAHAHVLAHWHGADPAHVEQAIDAALSARREWASWSWQDRAAVFLRAAELLNTMPVGRRPFDRPPIIPA